MIQKLIGTNALHDHEKFQRAKGRKQNYYHGPYIEKMKIVYSSGPKYGIGERPKKK